MNFDTQKEAKGYLYGFGFGFLCVLLLIFSITYSMSLIKTNCVLTRTLVNQPETILGTSNLLNVVSFSIFHSQLNLEEKGTYNWQGSISLDCRILSTEVSK